LPGGSESRVRPISGAVMFAILVDLLLSIPVATL
jgi:hypothetical protein